MRKLRYLTACLVPVLILVVWAMPVSAAPSPVTYLNANFGPPNTGGFNFYRSTGTLQLDSATASVTAKAKNSQVELDVYANGDPNETSSAFSSYDVGTVNAGAQSLRALSVSPRTLVVSGNAHFAMNIWFDSDHNGEYFVWNQNQLVSLGGDVYGFPTFGSGPGPVTIDETTPLSVFSSTGPGCNGSFATTLLIINANGCLLNIPPNTNVARWVGIDISGGPGGSGHAVL